jgi:hypothetical protein
MGKMQTRVNLDRSSLGELVVSVFESGNPEVYADDMESSDDPGAIISARVMNAYIDEALKAHKQLFGFSIWYPETRGYVEKKKVRLDPTKGKGHAFRHSVKGWGIILLRFDFEQFPLISGCISCSSPKKVESWSGSHRNLKDPNLWDWGAVERHCKRLIQVGEDIEQRLAQSGVLQELLQLPRL